MRRISAFLLFSLLFFPLSGNASVDQSHSAEESKFGADEIIHHVSDDIGLHIIGDVSIPLPVIIYTSQYGLALFSSSVFHHADHSEPYLGIYSYEHGKLRVWYNNEPFSEARLTDLLTGNNAVFYNFSITKNVLGIILSGILLFILFVGVARRYRPGVHEAPRGLQNAMEPLVLFVRDEVVKPSVGEKHYLSFLPFFLTVFFFIWINNLLGLVPFLGGLNVTGNIAVTMTLAVMVLVVQVASANKHFWGHIFWFPGVPVPVKLVLAIIEVVGLFTKPFSLMIRLFANITAGHIIIMSIIGITFAYQGAVGYTVGIATSVFSVAMFMLELLVAAIQAYIFTLLAALMIGAAVEEPHHHTQH
jgi:F-type H+-transporting ATPase subunit a